jgi:hypothetical protein
MQNDKMPAFKSFSQYLDSQANIVARERKNSSQTMNSSDDESDNSYEQSTSKNFDFFFSGAVKKTHMEHMAIPKFNSEKIEDTAFRWKSD